MFYLNTSHVKVNHQMNIQMLQQSFYLNTSHVKVNRV